MWITGQGALRVDNGLERFVFLAGTEGFRVRLVGGRVPLRRFADRVGNVGVSAPTADRQTQAAPVLESGIAT